jgi:hypothetical protein
LYKYGLTPQKYEKIAIQIDTFDQGATYDTEVFILNKFEFFKQIQVTPQSVLLAQKLWTITQRPRLKGRDFFDCMFLLQKTKPDMQFLEAKFGSTNIEVIVSEIISGLQDTDWGEVIEDVRPFLIKPEDARSISLFPQFLRQQLL